MKLSPCPICGRQPTQCNRECVKGGEVVTVAWLWHCAMADHELQVLGHSQEEADKKWNKVCGNPGEPIPMIKCRNKKCEWTGRPIQAELVKLSCGTKGWLCPKCKKLIL